MVGWLLLSGNGGTGKVIGELAEAGSFVAHTNMWRCMNSTE